MSRRVLIDECLPIQLHHWLDGFDARTVAFMGWAGKRDRELLEAARGLFDVVLTSDALMSHEHDLAGYGLGLVVVPTNRKRAVQRLVRAVREALTAVAPGERRVVAAAGPDRAFEGSSRASGGRQEAALMPGARRWRKAFQRAGSTALLAAAVRPPCSHRRSWAGSPRATSG